jgi:ABC-2 type transport system ATP-binding protein
VRRGQVYGFLGPNGAGKTTTIACALGLIAPSAGHVEMFGLDTRVHLTEAIRRTGSTLEGQSYFPHLSARNNLRIWAAISRGAGEDRIDEVLELVGLRDRAGDKVRNYSLGMKQRLSVAAAVMHRPEMIILDEPTNGLDPAGIREFRDLVRDLSGGGMTVFVSSHILSEVEQMCDEVAILKSGRLITQAPVSALTRGATSIELSTTDDAAALPLLQAIPWVTKARAIDGRIVVDATREQAWELSRQLGESGIWLKELRPSEGSLEDFFLEVTGEMGER